MDVPTEQLMRDLKTLAGDAEELIRATAQQGGEQVARARARAEESLRAARERIQEAGSDLDDQVRAHPWASIGVAAGVGLVVGILLGRK